MTVDRETVKRLSDEVGMGWVSAPDILRNTEDARMR